MSIPSLTNAVLILQNCELSEVALGTAVGVAIAFAIPLPNDTVDLNKTSLANFIASQDKAFGLISEANESVLLCTDTAIRSLTVALTTRLQFKEGVLKPTHSTFFTEQVLKAASEMVGDFRSRLV